MKILHLIFWFSLFITFSAQAQKEGTITFNEITKLNIELPKDLPISEEEFRKMVPSERQNIKVLYFNTLATLYRAMPTPEDFSDEEINRTEGNMNIQIKMVGTSADDQMYTNLQQETQIEQKDFMGKTFLIINDQPKYTWKLVDETKDILGYQCRKAVTQKGERHIEAWFTSNIPISSGPASYLGLPGMILELKSNQKNGSSKQYLANKISLEPISNDVLQVPKKGKKVTLDKFAKIVKEKTDEMKEQMGGTRVKVIRN